MGKIVGANTEVAQGEVGDGLANLELPGGRDRKAHRDPLGHTVLKVLNRNLVVRTPGIGKTDEETGIQADLNHGSTMSPQFFHPGGGGGHVLPGLSAVRPQDLQSLCVHSAVRHEFDERQVS